MAKLFALTGHFDGDEARMQLVIAADRDAAEARFEGDAQSELDPADYEDGLPEFYLDGCLEVGDLTGPTTVEFDPSDVLE